ncbi:hypothetical protein ACP4OV_000644 [Aristida adscensionis]
MVSDGCARGLKVEVAIAAGKVRKLREAAASLAACRGDADAAGDADEDLLQCRAPTLDFNIRRIEGSLSSLNPFTLDKVTMDGNMDSESLSSAATEKMNKLSALQKMSLEPNTSLLLAEKVLEGIRSQSQKEKEVVGTKKRRRSSVTIGCPVSTPPNTAHLDIQLSITPTQMSPVQKKSRRTRTKKSLAWRHFETGTRGQDPIATCKYCGKVYICDANHGTGTLWNHLRNLCPKEPLKENDSEKKEPGTPTPCFSIEDCRKALAAMVITDEFPFKIVDGAGFKRYSKVLQPRFELPSRITSARDCMKRYVEEKPKLKKLLKNHRICLTTDTWTSNQNLSYMTSRSGYLTSAQFLTTKVKHLGKELKSACWSGVSIVYSQSLLIMPPPMTS